MNTLGIYFGPQLINIVETKGNAPVNYIQISRSLISPDKSSEEKVPEELKIIALLKGELEKNKIELNEATVSLSGKDLIIRTFEMPILPPQELEGAVNFEVKKYIPFKTEELISDFQWQLDKTIKKTRVLFIGIKKDILEKYLLILKGLELKIKSIEYSAFSVLRLLNLSGIKQKGIIAVANIDLVKEDEANFVVLENGFPLFSRDITFGGYEEPAEAKEVTANMVLEKIRREVQISLDYYGRKFSGKNIAKIFFITHPNYWSDLEGYVKELGFKLQFIDVNKYIGKAIPFSLTFVKGYSSSLSKIALGLKINLLSVQERGLRKRDVRWAILDSLVMFLQSKVVRVSLLVCLATFLFGVYRILPLRNELKNIINMQPKVSGIPLDSGDKELSAISSHYKKKIEDLNQLIKKRLYLTPLLDSIPRLIPKKGMWLVELSFKKGGDKTELILEGVAYLGDRNRELELVNRFLAGLKEDAVFTKTFKEISVVSIEYKQIPEAETGKTNFIISCQSLY